MKNIINAIYHGLGYLIIAVGCILCLGAAGNSDLGMSLPNVVRYECAGLSACLCGAFLVWWKV